MTTQISKAAFENLLEDDVFVDYLNKFLALPVFGQRVVYRKKQDTFLFEPALPNEDECRSDENYRSAIIEWIWERRLPFFFRSLIYAEYKLARALIEYDLVEDGGVEEHVARGLEYLQFHCFSKMSRFSKFCKFLSETGEGLKLVAFFLAAQHLFVAFYEGEADFPVLLGEVRDRFFDETSPWCLPNKVLEVTHEQSNSIAFCMVVSQRVLSRICLYWLPRYLLHLRMDDFKNDPELQSAMSTNLDLKRLSESFLHQKIFKTDSMQDDIHQIESLSSLNDLTQPIVSLPTRSALRFTLTSENDFTRDMTKSDVNFRKRLGPESSIEFGRGPSQMIRDRSTVAERRKTIRQESRRTEMRPGVDIKVERKKSVKPSMLNLSSKISQIRGPSADFNRLSSAAPLKGRDQNGKPVRESQVGQTTVTTGGRCTVGQQMKRSLVAQSKTSVTSIASRAVGVSKAINQFKANRQTLSSQKQQQNPEQQKQITDKNDEKVKKLVKATNDEKLEKAKRERKKYTKRDHDGPIGPMKESKNVFKLSKAVGLKKERSNEDTTPQSSDPESSPRSKPASREGERKKVQKESKMKLITEALKKDDDKKEDKDAEKPTLASVVKAKGILSAWKKKANQTIAKRISESDEARDTIPKSGLKMVFAMSHQKKEEEKTVKLIQKKDNRLIEEESQIEDDSNKVDEPLPEQYLRKRRNALGKVKPIRTLRKRPHSEMPNTEQSNAGGSKGGEKSKDKANKNVDQLADQGPQTAEGKRKAEFIKKALMVKNKMEKITVVRADAGDQIISQMYTLNDDYVFRHELRHLAAALRSDDFAAGPFMNFITDEESDETSMYTLCYWQEVERFREAFSGMQQSDLILAMDSIMTKYILNDRGFSLIPGMSDYGIHMLDVDILSDLTFPWQLRLLQRFAMEHLQQKWKRYMQADTESLYDKLNDLSDYEAEPLPVEHLEQSVAKVFEEEIPPAPLPTIDQKYKEMTRESTMPKAPESAAQEKWKRGAGRTEQKPGLMTIIEQARSRASHSRLCVDDEEEELATKRQTRRTQVFMNPDQMKRLTLGHDRFSQMNDLTRDVLLAKAMARRSKRAYSLAEQTCRLTARHPHTHTFLADESDDEGFVRPKPKPVYLRKPKIDPKKLVEMASNDFVVPASRPQKSTVMRSAEKQRTPPYMKETVRKNGAVLKRPMMRPKHLIDCLRDPVHFEFFRRFAKAYHFERSVRFWKQVEVMKHVDDSRQRHLKIKAIVSQFFSKGATTGVGIDGQVLREIMRTPPEKVTVSMLISAQACVMKALEDTWSDRYLATFQEVKRSTAQTVRAERTEIMGGMAAGPGQMTKIWRIFYAFIKRSAKFIRCMKNREIRIQFEQYLETVGRDPSVYHSEGWTEIPAQSIDTYLNPELMYHQKKQQGRNILAEFLINDFRFWCEVECYRNQAEAVHQSGNVGHYSAQDEENLHMKAQLICDQFLNSPILPRCRINIQPEISATIIENVKLGMFDLSLFHDCTINIFPLLLNYWKIFCLRRHKYIPRAEISQFKQRRAAERRGVVVKKKAKKSIKADNGDSPLIDYCTSKRYTHSWMDIVRCMDDYATMSFSVQAGVKLNLPPPQKKNGNNLQGSIMDQKDSSFSVNRRR